MSKDWISSSAANIAARVKALGRTEKTFFALLILYLVLACASPHSILLTLLQLTLTLLATWILLRMSKSGIGKAIWSLRNRLLVTYVFLAVVPVFLVALLAGLGGYAVISQLAVYLAVADLDRRARSLHDVAQTLAAVDAAHRLELMPEVCELQRRRFPQLSLIVRENGTVQSWPPQERADVPPGWGDAEGVAVRGSRYYLWSHAKHNGTDVTAAMPLSRAYLSDMVPGLGDVSLLDISDAGAPIRTSHEPPAKPLPEPYNRFDIDVPWFSFVSAWQWEHPGKKQYAALYVHTRPSAVLNTIFNTRVDQISDLIPVLLLVVSVAFLLVEIAALVIGVSLTRSITRAVHNLYRGTRRVMEGDFSHRIQVYGRDQLADLSTSFNSMTENLERLLAVAKEKERLTAEIEIAQQVQAQLYPKQTPELRTLRLTATCQPARMVSGDYYDYLCLSNERLALAIGDVAGKGISAALLMASIQSAMRMELRASQTQTPATSKFVADLNQQLHANTAPEKYATFFFAIYSEQSGVLNYTNAGHLPPLLVRRGTATPLHVNGTVVGAFPFAAYENDCVQLESGDLLVCYTDGITEPENEYGEEFGESRLIDVVTKNADRDETKIMTMILDAVRQWTRSGGKAVEQADDMTLLLARKI